MFCPKAVLANPLARANHPPATAAEPLVALEPNHSHFLLVDVDEWGQEIDAMFALAKGLANQVPVVTVLVNGGDLACQEVLRSVRQGWPVIVVSGLAGNKYAVQKAVASLTKPFDPDQLIGIVKDTLG